MGREGEESSGIVPVRSLVKLETSLGHSEMRGRSSAGIDGVSTADRPSENLGNGESCSLGSTIQVRVKLDIKLFDFFPTNAIHYFFQDTLFIK